MRWWFLVLVAGCGRLGFDASDGGTADVAIDAGPRVWTPQVSGAGGVLFTIWGSSATDIYAVGDNEIVHSTGTGVWTDVTPAPVSYYGVFGTSASNVYAVGNLLAGQAVIAHFTSPSSASIENSGVARPLNGVWASSPTDLYAVGYDGIILHSTGNGIWTPQTSGTTVSLHAIWGRSATDIYVVGYTGVILHSIGDGTWTPQVSGTPKNLIGIWGDATALYAVGYAGTVLRSTQPGVWTPEVSGTVKNLLYVWGAGPNDLFASGSGNELLHSRRDGTWTVETVIEGATQLDGIWSSSVDDIYLIGAPGLIVHAE